MKIILIVILFMCLTIFIIVNLLSVPLVIISNSGSHCIRVDSLNPSHSCDNLPEFYFTIYTR